MGQANLVLSFHIQTALLALREPHFQSHYYSNLGGLFRGILSQRIDGVKALRRQRLGSEDDLAELLLGSVMPILLDYERTGISEGHERLEWAKLCGPLDSLACSPSPRRYTLAFLDDLAKQRDELWAQERIKREAAVTALDKSWPKGLPVQYLLPSESWTIAALTEGEAAPFVSERVKKVLFSDPETMLGHVPEYVASIGACVDSLPFAIRCYVATGKTKDDRVAKGRINSAI